jgi:hypothetical protein
MSSRDLAEGCFVITESLCTESFGIASLELLYTEHILPKDPTMYIYAQLCVGLQITARLAHCFHSSELSVGFQKEVIDCKCIICIHFHTFMKKVTQQSITERLYQVQEPS